MADIIPPKDHGISLQFLGLRPREGVTVKAMEFTRSSFGRVVNIVFRKGEETTLSIFRVVNGLAQFHSSMPLASQGNVSAALPAVDPEQFTAEQIKEMNSRLLPEIHHEGDFEGDSGCQKPAAVV